MAKHPGFLPGHVPPAYTPIDNNPGCGSGSNLPAVLALVLNIATGLLIGWQLFRNNLVTHHN